MKKAILVCISLVLASVLLLSGCAKKEESTASTDENSKETTQSTAVTESSEEKALADEGVFGVWYTIDGVLKMDLKPDLTAELSMESIDGTQAPATASYTALDGKFKLSPTDEAYGEYAFDGDYVLEGDVLTVTVGETQTVFVRKVGGSDRSIVYIIENIYYELVLYEEGGGVCRHFPPDDEEVVVIYYIENNIIHVTPNPPTGESEIPKEHIPVTIPPEGEPELPDGSSPDKVLESGGSIVGTWTSSVNMDVYILDIYETNTDIGVVYTFNEDGSGSVMTLGMTFPLSYSYENNILTLSVTGFGNTNTGSGFAQIVGDAFYVTNDKGEVTVLTKMAS